jgi:hypothetical protein
LSDDDFLQLLLHQLSVLAELLEDFAQTSLLGGHDVIAFFGVMIRAPLSRPDAGGSVAVGTEKCRTRNVAVGRMWPAPYRELLSLPTCLSFFPLDSLFDTHLFVSDTPEERPKSMLA